jgi:hypothetical protein
VPAELPGFTGKACEKFEFGGLERHEFHKTMQRKLFHAHML